PNSGTDGLPPGASARLRGASRSHTDRDANLARVNRRRRDFLMPQPPVRTVVRVVAPVSVSEVPTTPSSATAPPATRKVSDGGGGPCETPDSSSTAALG